MATLDMSGETGQLPKVQQGATYHFGFIYGDVLDANADPITYDAVPLTGVTAKLQVRQNYAETAAGAALLLEVTTEDGGIVVEPEGQTGLVQITFSAAKTDALLIRKGRYDLELYFPNGEVVRLLEGRVAIDPSVTA